jgi:hypothetical protein
MRRHAGQRQSAAPGAGIGSRTVSSMHQQLPSALALPHWNAAPQRAQASFRSGKVRAGIMVALSGGIAGKINHAAVTSLRRMEQARNTCFVAFSSTAREPWKLSRAMPIIKALFDAEPEGPV